MNVLATMPTEIKELSETLAPLQARERVECAYQEFGKDLILATSFGPKAGVMIKLATSVYPEIRVITIRHGYESSRTRESAERMQERFNLDLHVYEAPQLLIPDEGTPEFDDFRYKVKIEPFQKALAKERPRAWLSGVMRDETEQRKTFDFAMYRDGLVVVYPILDWDEADAEEYSLAHRLFSYEGYYDPTKGFDQKKECGLHLGQLGTSWTSSSL